MKIDKYKQMGNNRIRQKEGKKGREKEGKRKNIRKETNE
jgi:hypothetical protein